jgi:hypothetical protein
MTPAWRTVTISVLVCWSLNWSWLIGDRKLPLILECANIKS